MSIRHHPKGFTLVELMVVMAILATLLSIVAPRYLDSVDNAKEAALRTNLRMTREAIDKYKADTGKYPDSLTVLIDARYLRELPYDPIKESNSNWTLLSPPEGTSQGVYDIKSNAEGETKNGTPFSAL